MDYGKAIKLLRAMRQLEQQELATRAGLDSSYISLIEARKRVPSTNAIAAIADALRVPIYLLMIIASETSDLQGMPVAVADHIGSALLRVVVDMDGEAKSEHSVSEESSVRSRRRKTTPRATSKKKPQRS